MIQVVNRQRQLGLLEVTTGFIDNTVKFDIKRDDLNQVAPVKRRQGKLDGGIRQDRD